jgi:hypothetical protein
MGRERNKLNSDCHGTQNVTGFNQLCNVREFGDRGDICAAGIVCPWCDDGVVMVM